MRFGGTSDITVCPDFAKLQGTVWNKQVSSLPEEQLESAWSLLPGMLWASLVVCIAEHEELLLLGRLPEESKERVMRNRLEQWSLNQEVVFEAGCKLTVCSEECSHLSAPVIVPCGGGG